MKFYDFFACTEFLRMKVKHFIPIRNIMIRCPPLSPTFVTVAIALAALSIALFHAIALFLPSRSLLPPSPLPFAFNPRHHCSPTTVFAAAIALIAVACLHCRLHRYCYCPWDHGRGDVPHQLYWHEGGYIKILSERVTCFEI